MIRVVEALLDQALRGGNREIGDFLAKLLAGAAHILLHLLARARHEPRSLGLGSLDQSFAAHLAASLRASARICWASA